MKEITPNKDIELYGVSHVKAITLEYANKVEEYINRC